MKTRTLRADRKSRSSLGTLAIVGTLFFVSCAVRLATEAGYVVAGQAGEPTEFVAEEIAQESDLELARPEHLTHALKAIQAREARVAEREQEIEARENSVEAAEDAIRKELEKLQQAETSLRETISLASDAAENDIAQLTSVYTNMKPKQAAALFEQMEASFAAGFLFRMPPDSAARVMAGMSPEKAYLVSLELASRNANIPME